MEVTIWTIIYGNETHEKTREYTQGCWWFLFFLLYGNGLIVWREMFLRSFNEQIVVSRKAYGWIVDFIW